MMNLGKLQDTSRERKPRKRVGRGPGSGVGKTCGRGEKGAGARSGYKRRFGYEGGRFPLYRKVPCRGFSNARFRKAYDAINLSQIDALFSDGEVVSAETLTEKGYLSGPTYGIKILGEGELNKKVTLEIEGLSETAREKLEKAKIKYTVKS